MSNLYNKTTESLESLGDTTCAPRLKGFASKSPKKSSKNGAKTGHDEYELGHLEQQEFPVDHPDFDQTSIGMISDTNVQPSSGRTSLSRQKSLRQFRQSVTNSTLHFFGVDERDDEELLKEKWRQRRMRHLSRLGKIKSLSSPSTPDVVDGRGRFQNIVDFTMQRSYVGRRAKRENAAKLLWKSASRRLSAKPVYDVSTIQSFGGRSFAPADLIDDDISVFESMSHLGDDQPSRSITPTPIDTPSLLDHFNDKSFFVFDTYPQDVSTIEEERSFDIDETDNAGPPTSAALRNQSFQHAISPPSTPSPQIVSSWDPNLGPEPIIQSLSPKTKRLDAMRPQNERRGRIQNIVKKKKLKPLKREFGKGLVGKLLNRTFNRSRINSKVREQMEEISDHRPYFTYWLSFVQIVILIVMLSIYPLAEIGVSQKTIKEERLISRNGVLQKEKLPNTVVESFWIGPSLSTLILLGAKFAPCMRRDTVLFKTLEEERLRENSTGCCLQNLNTGCIQRQQAECSSSFTTFKANKVCGQDPKACEDPVSSKEHPWDPHTIINWPVCRKITNKSNLVDLPHMLCDVTGRPCCIGTQAQCIITSQDYCEYKKGVYHKDKTLCSQVDCLEATCGLLSFSKKDQPDQFYRLYLSLFLNAGVLHIIIVLIFNFTVLRDIEKMAGWLRTTLIYMLSGIGGNLWSAILIPYEPEVGPSGAAFGIIACLFVELIQGWQLVVNPFKHLAKLGGIVLVLFLLGLLPYIDNFAHIFGFIYGFFLALIFLPYVTFGEWDRRRKRIQIVGALVLVISLTVVGFILFYIVQDVDTTGVEFFNCIKINENFCKNFHQGRHLEKRETVY